MITIRRITDLSSLPSVAYGDDRDHLNAYVYAPFGTGETAKCESIATVASVEIVQARNEGKTLIILSSYAGDKIKVSDWQ